MGGAGPDEGASYSNSIGSIYVFNLIVGAGALSLPNAFSQAGYISGTALLLVLAFFSYATSTFMVEAMSIANALKKRRAMHQSPDETGLDTPPLATEPGTEGADTSALLTALTPSESGIQGGEKHGQDLFDITDRSCSEMAALAGTFFTPLGEKFFYLTLIIYLYGDLCIYAAAVPVSLQNVVCPKGENATRGAEAPCPALKFAGVTVGGSYYVFLVIFILCLGPFTYVGISKTKYLQMFTTAMRWITFILLISLCIAGITGAGGHVSDFEVYAQSTTTRTPSKLPTHFTAASLSGTTFMFGASVYSFMCQHSLPSLVSPISNQERTGRMLFVVFVVVALFYILLVFSAMFRFEADALENKYYKGVYTLVWQKFPSTFVSIFLQMFPVFVLSTNFPIISITLRNNLITLGTKMFGSNQNPIVLRYVYPTLAIGPPVVVALFTNDVGSLISITGSYAGTGIQYIIPAMALLRARRTARETLGVRLIEANNKRSPFGQGNAMILIVLLWAAACLVLVTWNHIKSIPSVQHGLHKDGACDVHAMLLQSSGVHDLVSDDNHSNCSLHGPWRGP